jgi:hypothetical protein
MPTYNFKSNKTGKECEDTMSYKKLDEYYAEHDCQQVFHQMQKVVAGTKSLWSQTDDGFKDRMQEINKVAGNRGMKQTDYDR